MTTDWLHISDRSFQSRLLLGTGKFASPMLLKAAVVAAESDIVTVALRRVDLDNPEDDFLRILDTNKTLFLPNTSGARTADEAVLLAKIARDSGGMSWIKLEVISDARYLLPDANETRIAAERLVHDGFTVLPYIQADPVLAKDLEKIGCATVMPLASPIGSNQGLQTKSFIQIIIEQATIPVIVDAGLGTPSHAAQAMEMGADAVLVNTAIATAPDPIAYATAFRYATQAGRMAFLSGHPITTTTAVASSPLTGFLNG